MKTTTQKNLMKALLFILTFMSCTGLCYLLDYFKIDNLNFLMIYILGVLLVAIFSDKYILSLIFSLLSVFTYNFLFTTPRMSFEVFDLKYIITFILMFAISFTVSTMTYNLKKNLIKINELNKEKFRIEKKTEEEKTKATMLRSISHDLRTPLTAISSGTELILSNNHLSEEEKNSILKDMQEKANWTVTLVENLLFLTRVEANGLNVIKEDEAVEEIIPEAIRNVSPILGHRKIKVDIPSEMLLIPVDATLITQLLFNLLSNAISFTNDDGTILIEVFSSNKNAVFRVINDGRKIADDKLNTIFDLYYSSTDRSSTGIGLAVCKAIAIAHSGSITARNSKTGVIFELLLPLGEKTV